MGEAERMRRKEKEERGAPQSPAYRTQQMRC